MNGRTVELLAPAGDFETALAAFGAGADAVYCGLADFSARAFAKNFTFGQLRDLVRVARAPKEACPPRRVYVTFNTLLDEDAFDDAVALLARLEEIGPDALIVQDLGVARLCRRHFPRLALHASTQLVAHNLEGVLALRERGFSRIVLARELSLDEIASIVRRCGDAEIECFIHGALCYSVSGLCLFSALEKDRSGNRGKCAYCCRLTQKDAAGRETLPFSMKDLRLGEDARKLVEAGVVSLKIEGRMKSPLYVASVTKYYREILDNATRTVSRADLETVFSRRTTELYFAGNPVESPVDPTSLGHCGTEIGVVKRITKDRDGVSWLRFHTARALERHDGLQFEPMVDGRHLGFGIGDMRQAISRHPVFEVAAGTDVEVRLPETEAGEKVASSWRALEPGTKVYCAMSNAVRRRFPMPAFRPSDYPGTTALDLTVTLTGAGVRAVVSSPVACEAFVPFRLSPAKTPERTYDAVVKALGKLGGTDYRLGEITLEDADKLFAPMSVLNDVRRDLVEKLDAVRDDARTSKIARVRAELESASPVTGADARAMPARTLRLRPDQCPPAAVWDEIVCLLDANAGQLPDWVQPGKTRLALPVYTAEPAFNPLRNAVKRLLRAGFDRWEVSDLATLRLVKALGVTDITADWTLYAFNSQALADLTELGVRGFVASPENERENLQYLAESGYPVSFLEQQSTPLFLSRTKPAADPEGLSVRHLNGLWVTTRPTPRLFVVPAGSPRRIDLSWDVAS